MADDGDASGTSSDDESSGGRHRRRSETRHGPLPAALSADAHTYAIFLLGNLLELGGAGVSGASSVLEIPVRVDAPIVHASCGLDWICVLTASGRAYTCGRNSYGQLGQGVAAALNRDSRRQASSLVPRPLLLPPGTKIAKISTGASHGGFVTDSGTLFMFGCGSYGRLGNGVGSSSTRTTGNQHAPFQVRMKWSALQAKAVRLSAAVSCGIPVVLPKPESLAASESGGVRTPETEESSDSEDDVRFIDVSCGDRHTLVLGAKAARTDSSRSSIISFGDGMNGRLGIGNEFDQSSGALVTTFKTQQQQQPRDAAPRVTAISAGASHNAALTSSGGLFTWGNGADGQLGHGGCASEWVPRQVAFFSSIALAAVRCGAQHSLAVTRTGAVYTWGRGLEGQLGVGMPHGGGAMVPQRVHLAVDPLAVHQMTIDAQIHAAAVTGASSGAAAATPLTSFSQQQDLRVTVRTIAASANVCMALDEHARLFSWGGNADRQLGFPPQDASTATRTRSDERSLVAGDTASPLRMTEQCDAVRAPRQLLYAELLDACSRGDSLVRQALVHFDTSECFTMLVFKTDPRSRGQVRAPAADQQPQPPRDGSGETELSLPGAQDRPENRSWQLLLHHELRADDVPSRQSAYFQFMQSYKVHVRPTPRGASGRSERVSNSRCLPDFEQCTYDIGERQLAAVSGSPALRPKSSDCSSQHSLSPRQANLSSGDRRGASSLENDDAAADDSVHPNQRQQPVSGGPSAVDPASPAGVVRRMESWLEKRSPTKPRAQRAFGSAERFRVRADVDRSTSKADEVQQLAWAASSNKFRASRPQSAAHADEAGASTGGSTRPKSAFGRTLQTAFSSRKVSTLAVGSSTSESAANASTRKPHANQVAPSNAAPQAGAPSTPSLARAPKSARAVSASRLQHSLKHELRRREREMRADLGGGTKPSLAAFGSSAKSRFALDPPVSAVESETPLHPETSAPLVYALSPSFSMGSGERYSMVIARRLAHARGPTPGPGTYDRRGG